MKSQMKMMCPLTGGVIDSDLCYDVQECIEGKIPVSLELEDFLEQGDCEKICHECEYNVLSDQWIDYDPADESDVEEQQERNVDEDGEYDLETIVNELGKYKNRLYAVLGKEHVAYDKMTTDWQESDEGQKLKNKLRKMHLGMNHFDDAVSAFRECVESKTVCDDVSKKAEKAIEVSSVAQKIHEENSALSDEWVEQLQNNIQVMVNTFRFSGLDEPNVTCSMKNYDGLVNSGTKLDIYVELTGVNGKPVKEDFVLKLMLYKSNGTLVRAEEIDVPRGSFKGYNTYRFHFEKFENIKTLAYGRLFVSKF